MKGQSFLVAFLVPLLLPSGALAGNKEEVPKVKRIECPADPAVLNSVIGFDLEGSLRKKKDQDALGQLLLTTFRRETALQCDPFHRVLLQADFTPYPIMGDQEIQLPFYHVKVLSYGKSPCKTALEPEPPEYVATDKHPTGDVCKVPQILRELRGYYSKYDDPCPLLGCYCPNELLGEETTTGVTEYQLADRLNDNLYRRRYEPRRGNNKGNAKFLPKVEAIESVSELRKVVPPAECAAILQPFDALLLTFLNVHPCDLSKATLQAFVEELVKDYNLAQIQACDEGFRRINTLDFALPECPAGGNGGGGGYRHRRGRGLQGLSLGSLPPLGLPTGAGSSTETTTTSQGSGRRRHLQKRHWLATYEEEDEEAVISLQSLPWTNRSLAKKRKKNKKGKGNKESGELCLCSAFVKETTSGITNDEFTALADQAMKRVTGGAVRVLEQFETRDVGCPCLKRFAFETHLAVAINVKVNSLTPDDFAQLQNDCRVAYNNIVTEQCSEDYFIVQECEVTPLEQHYYHYMDEHTYAEEEPSFTETEEEGWHPKYMLSFYLRGTTCAKPKDKASPFMDDSYRRRGTRVLSTTVLSTSHNATTTRGVHYQKKRAVPTVRQPHASTKALRLRPAKNQTTTAATHLPVAEARELGQKKKKSKKKKAIKKKKKKMGGGMGNQDECPCPLGVEPGGDKPTLEQYVDALNMFGLGIVESATETGKHYY